MALETWNKENGLFMENMEMEAGEYIVLPNAPGQWFPETGGVILLMIMLHLEEMTVAEGGRPSLPQMDSKNLPGSTGPSKDSAAERE